MLSERNIIEIDEDLCNGCGQCVPGCAEGALQIVNGKARMVGERYCDGLGACLGECPTGALRIVTRPAEEFDPEAVEAHLAALQRASASGCPSGKVQILSTDCACAAAPQALDQSAGTSELGHWPIKIRLVPPQAPFLNDAHLLVTADCVAAALPEFNRKHLPGKVLLMGCPKFDSAPDYVEKFQDIFSQADVRRITVLIMEVPCCRGLPVIVQKGMEAAGKNIPLEVQVVTTRGMVK